jgi:hypothetical protein
MDSATKAAWLAGAGAAAAALFAVWSAWSSHRSARSAAGALAIEREREHDRLAPRIRVEESTFEDKQEGIRFTSDGPRDYTSVHFRVETPAAASPVSALQIGEAWIPISPQGRTQGDLGPMAQGDRHLVPYQRADPWPGSTLRLRITCTNNQGTWTIHREVEISPPILDTIG